MEERPGKEKNVILFFACLTCFFAGGGCGVLVMALLAAGHDDENET